MRLSFDRGGEGERLLVLLHGLGATRHVWAPMIEERRWRGVWMAPDLRGHGTSPRGENYSLDEYAVDVAELAAGGWRETIVVGHSMGGAIALALASGRFGTVPARVFGLGIKAAWSDAESARLSEMAAAPVRWFASENEAVARYLKVSGLAGLIAESSPAAKAGVARGESGWRLAADPKTHGVGPPPMRALADRALTPFHLARGETDPLVTRAQLSAFDRSVADLSGLGHNAMVENAAAVWDWIEGKMT